MDTSQVTKALQKFYQHESSRVVFWNDPDHEFEELLGELSLEGVEIVRLDNESALSIKARILAEPQTKFLLYSPDECPRPEHDWLLDLRLWGQSFSADRASMLLTELGLASQSLRGHLKERMKFLGSKDRVTRLKRLVQANDDELDLDRKIMSVIVRSEQPDFFSLLIAALAEMDPGDLDVLPACWDEFDKYGLIESFWALVRQSFDYGSDTDSLNSLVLRLFVSEMAHAINEPLPEALNHLCFSRRGRANASVCLAHWRDSATRSGSYEQLARSVASVLQLQDQLSALPPDALVDCSTVLEIDRLLVRRIRDEVVSAPEGADLESITSLCSKRMDGFWVSVQRADSDAASRTALRSVYQAIGQAVDLFALAKSELPKLEVCTSAEDGFTAYRQCWFQFDQGYRIFCEHAAFAAANDWDVLKQLQQRIEDLYGNGFLARLGLTWSKMIDGAMLESWCIKDIPNQQSFFDHFVRPVLDQGDDRRVFVIVSDALRYEVAEELGRELNGRYRMEAELEAQLGVLPSYTGLGMASLLPHKTLTYTSDGKVEVDGKSTAGLAQRGKILASVGGAALKAEDLMKMTKDAGRDFIKPHRVVYIYHDHIDAMGDKPPTESQTFDAVRKTIEELGDVIGRIINSLNGAHIFVTADHGFLFQLRPPDLTDKSEIKTRPAGAVIAKKRYVLGHKLGENKGVFHGNTKATAGVEGDMEFWIPRSNNRFHFVGGARFVHGGAMLQEIVVPVIRVHQTRGASAEKTRVKSVGVSVLGTNFKITTNRHVFNLIQTEAVSQRVKAVTLKVGVFEGSDPVSNVETVTFQNTSRDMNEWKRSVRLTLQSRSFDSKNEYWLILRDAETGVEAGRYDLTIDLAFNNDF